jgi:spoIIIJ-associated protein
MEPFIEFEGKNVDHAIQNACKELKISKESIKYDIITSGSTGIFGLVGVKKAKIRVKTLQSSEDALSYKKDRDVQKMVDDAFNDKKQGNNNKPKNKNRDTGKKLEEKEFDVSDEIIEKGRESLQKILDIITTDAMIKIERKSSWLLYNVSGGNSSIIIGRRGQNLEAIQYIVEKILNKCSEKRVRVQIDVEGYLESRKVTLIRLASNLAEKAKRTGKPTSINKMNSQDRRTVHLSLKNNKSVRTQSIGDGYYRKLVIFPKKNGNKRRPVNDKA